MSHALLICFILAAVLSPIKREENIILSPDLQGVITLSGGITMIIGYGTVLHPVPMTVSMQENDLILEFDLASTELGMLFSYADHTYITDAPGRISPLTDGDYLIYFDTVQVFAQSLENSHQVFGLGMIEKFSTAFPVQHEKPDLTVAEKIGTDGHHSLALSNGKMFTSAAHLPHYAERFAGQNFGHPATFQFLGWAKGKDLPDILRAMLPGIPPGLPLPGTQISPMKLWLPFDCTHDWLVSWGYHFSTQQNRYAVDFTSAEGAGLAAGLPVRAAHAGKLFIKQFGYAGYLIDLGYAVQVISEDGVTSTEYGHLDEKTLSFWNVTNPEPFEWIEIGQVEAGEIIGFTGQTGYATGPHIHFALWMYDQSLYRPSFDTAGELKRGMTFPASSRVACERYP